MLHKDSRGEGVPPVATVRSRIGRRKEARHEEAGRGIPALLGMAATSKGKRDPV